ncbi:uncharacterized protein LOC135346688 isoform X2 [Halichondria panicea]|uniref:uncharacterized protein LOC135346688 isoform X2 n=1 Tax=Halichondria panicea TaxID=6063 RepID=UPI00312BC347
MDSEELATLTAEYVNKQSCRRPLDYTMTVRFSLSGTVNELMEHLSASYNGLQSSTGKELYLLTKHKEVRLDRNKYSTLSDIGVQNNAHIELRGYRPISKKHYVYPLVVIDPAGKEITLQVTNRTDLMTLKHKLQNKTGIRASEISLYFKGKPLPKSHALTVELYGGRSSRKQLKMKLVGRHLRDSSLTVTGARLAEKDGAYRVPSEHLQCTLSADQNNIPVDLPSSQSTDFSRDLVVSTIGFLDLSRQKFNLFRLALRLGIPQGDLQAIEANFRNDLEGCKLRMFLKWKERNGDDATWKKLIDAVLEEGNKEFVSIIKNIACVQKNSESDTKLCD